MLDLRTSRERIVSEESQNLANYRNYAMARAMLVAGMMIADAIEGVGLRADNERPMQQMTDVIEEVGKSIQNIAYAITDHNP